MRFQFSPFLNTVAQEKANKSTESTWYVAILENVKGEKIREAVEKVKETKKMRRRSNFYTHKDKLWTARLKFTCFHIAI